MILQITYDSSVSGAPAGFTSVINAVVDYFQTTFLDPVTVNINVGFGEVFGNPLGGGALGSSLTYLSSYSYTQLKAALVADAKSSDDSLAAGTLPASSPAGGATYWVSTAEAKALGLEGASSDPDGYVGFSSIASIFDYDNSNGVSAGQYDFFGTVAHEISEVMGRQLLVGATLGGTPNSYEPLDLFHYAAPGVRTFIGTQTGYFSIDGGVTNLNNFNTSPSGDFGDWAGSAGNDAYLAFSNSGRVNAITPSDEIVMDILGWDVTAAAATADLTATNLVLSSTGVSYQIHNNGNAGVAPSTTGIFLSADANITAADLLLTTQATPALGAGASDSESVSFAFPTNLAQGTYYVGALADSNGQIAETNELNNASNAAPVILGNDSGNVLTGTSGNDLMFGFDGNDTLNGGTGSDTMAGGLGDDTYVAGSTGDVVKENQGEGTDTVQSSISYTLSANVENLTLTGSSTISGTGNLLANVITGNSGNNILVGLGGADMLNGGLGTDTATYAASLAGIDVSLTTGLCSGGDAEGDTLANIENITGSGLGDTIEGNGGNNVLAGGNGVDTLSYVHAAAGVTVNLALTSAQNTVGAGTDTVTGFENLTGTGLNDVMTGNSGANVLMGLAGNDSLNGGSGNDTLDGGLGADSMAGGTGNDTFFVDDAGDAVSEASGAGTDTVMTTLNAYTLGINLENLIFTGAGNFAGIGNTLANAMTSGAGNDSLDGGSGNDTLDGGLGADSMTGGLGNDTFLVDDAGDTVIEAVSGGTDTVKTALASYALGAEVENLIFTGAGDFLGTGNTLANAMTGGAGNDSLDGGSGNDTLDGGLGADSMTGGLGNDTFLVDNIGDVVIEAASGGTDTVKATLASYALGANVENLTFTGAGDFAGSGNILANTLTGGAGNDTLSASEGNDSLVGGAGADMLTGGGGGDKFVFNSVADFAAGATLDTIADFNHAQIDKISLSTIDADTTFSGNQAFVFIGTAAFGNHAGELAYAVTASGVSVSGDVNGDGIGDFSLAVLGVASLVGSDFVL